jgi:hypothetical protein
MSPTVISDRTGSLLRVAAKKKKIECSLHVAASDWEA